MVDGIDANRRKWQDLHVSYQQTRRASLPSHGADTPLQTPEPLENASQQQAQDTKSTLEVEWLRSDDKPALVDAYEHSRVHVIYRLVYEIVAIWVCPLTLCYLNRICKCEIRCAHYPSTEALSKLRRIWGDSCRRSLIERVIPVFSLQPHLSTYLFANRLTLARRTLHITITEWWANV